MDDITKPAGSDEGQSEEAGKTQRMDAPGSDVPGAQNYATPPQYPTPPEYPGQANYAAPTNYTQPINTPPGGYSPPAQFPAAGAYAPPTPAPQPYQYNQYTAPQAPNPGPGGYYPAPSAYAANAPIRDPNVALAIEIVLGLIGFLGVGHLLTGRVVPGIILLAGWLIVGLPLIWFVMPLLTCGIGYCLSIPLWIAGPILSGVWLRSELIGQPLFRR